MHISELQKEINEIEHKIMEKGGYFEYPQLLRVLKVNEELGEMSRIILRLLVKTRKGDKLDLEQVKEELSLEIIDTMTPLIGIANHFNINLEEAFVKKLAINQERYKHS